MTGVLIRRGEDTQTHREKTTMGRWSQGLKLCCHKPRIHGAWKLEEARKTPLELSEGA